MENEIIKTNPVFKEIVERCWKNLGGTEELDRIEPEVSYQVFIAEAIQEAIQESETIKKFYPEAVVPAPSAITDLWREMKGFNLADSGRVGKGWKLTLFNPHKREWDCSRKVSYRWHKVKPKPEVS